MITTSARVLSIAAVCALPAFALGEQNCHSFSVPGVFDTVYNGNAATSVVVAAGGVNDCTGPARALELTCSLQSLHANTWASEARCDVTLPNGAVVSTRLCRLEATYGQIPLAKVRVSLPAGTSNADLTGLWGFRFRDTFNDSGGLAESRVSNVQVSVVTETVPGAHKVINAVDGVYFAKTDPQTDTGAYARSWVRIDGAPIVGGTGEYMRVDAVGSPGQYGPNRGNDMPYNGGLTVAIYNQNGEVLASGVGGVLSFNFGASGPDKRDGAAGSMAAGPSTSGPLYVSFTPWAAFIELDYDLPGYGNYAQYLDRSYPPFGVRGQEPALGYYDYSVRVQRGFEATSPDYPDLSTVYTGRPLSTVMAPATAGEYRFLRFRLPGPIVAANGDYLDIDTSSSLFHADYPSGSRNDTEIALYDASGDLIATDDDDGADFASSLSFGAVSPTRPAVSNGTAFNGRDGANLPAGEYYLALCMYNHSFADGFSVTNLTPLPTSYAGTLTATITAQVTPIVACGPADVGQQGGVEGFDGHLDNNDFIVFINRFFSTSPLADVGTGGGLPGSDGHLDNNDFIAFINSFFTGC